MPESEIKIRLKNCLYGLAIGDSISWNSLFHKSYLYPSWTRRIRREIDANAETTNILKTSLPFSLNQPSRYLNLFPTDDTEWVSFTIESLLSNNKQFNYQERCKEWEGLSLNKDKVRGSISVIGALNNFAKGLKPPQTGRMNPHYFDDAGMIRSIPIAAMYYSKYEEAVKYSEEESSITNAYDGIFAAKSVAAFISTLLLKNDLDSAVDGAIKELPCDSWIYMKVKQGLELSDKTGSLLDLAININNKLVDKSYNYGVSAPDILSCTFALLKKFRNNFHEILFCANAVTKLSDALTPLTGALAGLLSSSNILTDDWAKAVNELHGICIPHLKGKNYLKLINELID